ncbi:MAG: glucose-methanol-choline oxidoreductase [Reyranella sp.]|uniref:GMC family oxidoreductase n=1 Tax=Reyranella sp. TaxID=1929291 RepID=UPI0012095B64|nr:GMC family oxidoreductase N-terminal domain-containing protein [Reyranella sp.]TAJ94764.1 MAG: glucose-methanol-choline oxidoreductase [Reyranella sp.]TBR21819.1 MAG: glucose-methanol-choline oxidoreductase [Reyranella sp.]
MSGTPSFADNDGRGGLKRREALGAAMAGGIALSGLSSPAKAASGIRTLTSPAQLRTTYDHVIVGAGSAGCVLAHRLGQAGRRILLIEAGGRADLPSVTTPPAWPTLQESALDWRYMTTPQPGLGGRAITCPRGKAVGGSSIINALAYQRGHAAAYDRWPAGWRHADLLPYFRRAETFSSGANAWRGGDGPLHVLSLADVTDRTPVAEAFMAAAQQAGFPVTPDLGGEVTTGVGWNQLSIKGHRRDDAATAYLDSLESIDGETRVDLLTGTEVLGLEIERGRCLGVRLAGGIIRPEKEVLLCAGAIDSPRLLMLSGIGPADELRALGIESAANLPDVGRHLEDHPLLAGVAYQARRPVPASHYNHCDSLLYVPHATAGQSPDILVMCLSVPFVRPTVGPLSAPAYVLVPCHLQPRSRGSVRLGSSDPRVAAIIDPNYLGEPDDLAVLAKGVEIAREIGAAKAFDDWRAKEIYPGPAWTTEAGRTDFIRRATDSFHHPVGTCRIGAVVDEALRVKGIAGLRVIDASVLPGLPASMCNAAVTAVAEKASDLVLAG